MDLPSLSGIGLRSVTVLNLEEVLKVEVGDVRVLLTTSLTVEEAGEERDWRKEISFLARIGMVRLLVDLGVALSAITMTIWRVWRAAQ